MHKGIKILTFDDCTLDNLGRFFYNRKEKSMLNIKISKQSLKKAYLGQLCDYDTETYDAVSTDKLPDPDLILLQIMLDNYHRRTDGGGSLKVDGDRKITLPRHDTESRALCTVFLGQSARGIH